MMSILHPVFLCTSIAFIFSRKFLDEALLTDAIKLCLILPSLHLMYTALNVYPRKSNSVSSSFLFLSLSLQYTILVFTGCSSSLHSSNLRVSFSFIHNAFSFVRQWITPSSVYLSKGALGKFLTIHISNTMIAPGLIHSSAI